MLIHNKSLSVPVDIEQAPFACHFSWLSGLCSLSCHAGFVPNTSDDEGLYSFQRQPEAAKFNLRMLWTAMGSLFNDSRRYEWEWFLTHFAEDYFCMHTSSPQYLYVAPIQYVHPTLTSSVDIKRSSARRLWWFFHLACHCLERCLLLDLLSLCFGAILYYVLFCSVLSLCRSYKVLTSFDDVFHKKWVWSHDYDCLVLSEYILVHFCICIWDYGSILLVFSRVTCTF